MGSDFAGQMLRQRGFRNNHHQHAPGLQSTEGTRKEEFFQSFGALVGEVVFGGKTVRRIEEQ